MNRRRAFTLIEVLAALSLLTVGLLACLAGVMAVGKRQQEAYYRTLAATIAMAMGEYRARHMEAIAPQVALAMQAYQHTYPEVFTAPGFPFASVAQRWWQATPPRPWPKASWNQISGAMTDYDLGSLTALTDLSSSGSTGPANRAKFAYLLDTAPLPADANFKQRTLKYLNAAGSEQVLPDPPSMPGTGHIDDPVTNSIDKGTQGPQSWTGFNPARGYPTWFQDPRCPLFEYHDAHQRINFAIFFGYHVADPVIIGAPKSEWPAVIYRLECKKNPGDGRTLLGSSFSFPAEYAQRDPAFQDLYVSFSYGSDLSRDAKVGYVLVTFWLGEPEYWVDKNPNFSSVVPTSNELYGSSKVPVLYRYLGRYAIIDAVIP